MYMKKPQHRNFDYTPRYYVPENDERERKKRRLGFSRQLKVRRQKRSPIIWVILIIILIIVILKLNGIS